MGCITSIRVEVQGCVCVFGPTFQHCVFAQETDLTGGLILDVKAQSRSKLHSRADESSLQSHSQGSTGRKKWHTA